MNNKRNVLIILCLCFTSAWTITSCAKDKTDDGTDQELYEMAKTTDGFVWFKGSDDLLDKSSGSGHPQAFLRTRYNAVAATKLDSDGKIVPGAVFPEGSLIVKELYANATTLERYAILYKQSQNINADANGWVWGYIDANGTVAVPASSKGNSCISCHSQGGNIDYMLMNKYFP